MVYASEQIFTDFDLHLLQQKINKKKKKFMNKKYCEAGDYVCGWGGGGRTGVPTPSSNNTEIGKYKNPNGLLT
jgi:hypothetical protein